MNLINLNCARIQSGELGARQSAAPASWQDIKGALRGSSAFWISFWNISAAKSFFLDFTLNVSVAF